MPAAVVYGDYAMPMSMTWPLRLLTVLFKGKQINALVIMDLIELIKSNNFQQQSYFNIMYP